MPSCLRRHFDSHPGYLQLSCSKQSVLNPLNYPATSKNCSLSYCLMFKEQNRSSFSRSHQHNRFRKPASSCFFLQLLDFQIWILRRVLQRHGAPNTLGCFHGHLGWQFVLISWGFISEIATVSFALIHGFGAYFWSKCLLLLWWSASQKCDFFPLKRWDYKWISHPFRVLIVSILLLS